MLLSHGSRNTMSKVVQPHCTTWCACTAATPPSHCILFSRCMTPGNHYRLPTPETPAAPRAACTPRSRVPANRSAPRSTRTCTGGPRCRAQTSQCAAPPGTQCTACLPPLSLLRQQRTALLLLLLLVAAASVLRNQPQPQECERHGHPWHCYCCC